MGDVDLLDFACAGLSILILYAAWYAAAMSLQAEVKSQSGEKEFAKYIKDKFRNSAVQHT
jgi:hypothetical protein